jgi:hypothetical protein
LIFESSGSFYKNEWWSWILGFFLVTNYYFYNLPSLLMAENLLIPLTLATVWLLMQKYSRNNFMWSVVVGSMLVLTKISGLPVLVIMGLGTLVKIPKKEWRYCFGWGIMVGAGLWLAVLWPNWQIYGGGNSSYSLQNAWSNSMIYMTQLMGKMVVICGTTINKLKLCLAGWRW